jgi:hypothetical protein
MVRCCLVIAVCMGALTAYAAPPSPEVATSPAAEAVAKEARAAFLAGQKAYKLGRFSEAIERFQQAYQLKPHPIIRFNLAKCFEQLDAIPQALQSYRTYLFEVPDTVDREAVTRSITALERKLARKSLQQLMVVAEPKDARVTVDGKLLGAPPSFVELGPGDHRLLIEREGLEPVSRSFVMSTQRSLELSFVLQPPPSTPAPSAQPARAAPSSSEAPPPSPPPLVLGAAGRPALRSKLWLPLIGFGVGAVLAGVGFYETGSSNAALHDELSAARQVTPTAERLASRGQTFQALAWVGTGVGVAGLLTAAVFFFFPGEAAVTPTVAFGPAGGTFALTGAF